MKINLFEIPEDGKQFEWTNKKAELAEVLADLIHEKTFKIEAYIRPLNSKDFEMTGTIKTMAPEQCSRCALDFDLDIDVRFQEIMIPHQPGDRTGKYARVNHLSDIHHEDRPSVVEYFANGDFDIAEYLHEQIALMIPFNPAPAEDKAGKCSLCHIPIQGQSFGFEDQMPETRANNPFEILKNLKKD